MNAQATAETVTSEASSTDALNDNTTPAEHVGSATYSPEDNKLRLYPLHRLDAETYARVKAAGFKWAPRQDLFVAPMWTPGREDLLIELCGSIEPEEMSLEERQAERAERFAEYSGKRAADSAAARRAVDSVAQHIPFGQPILVGHHSERRARKDAERIENNMRRAVRMWETAEYWQRRAAAAKAHADYKADPAVRARRIKSLEAEIRKLEREEAERAKALQVLTAPDLTLARAQAFSNISCAAGFGFYSRLTAPDAADTWRDTVADAVQNLQTVAPGRTRWMEHYRNRVAYERAMIDDAGGLVGEQQDLRVGGRVLVRGEWVTIVRVNRKEGRIVSVTTNARFVRVRPVEEIDAYEPPSEEQAAAVAARMKVAPLCNYPGEGFAHLTRAQWDRINKDYKGTRESGNGARERYSNEPAGDQSFERHRVRYAMGVFVPGRSGHSYGPVFITDEKVKEPKRIAAEAPRAPVIPAPEQDTSAERPRVHTPREKTPEQMQIDQMRDTLERGGIQVQAVHAPDLFPTPVELAARMVELADIKPGARVLEPSAGTGRILEAIAAAVQDVQTPVAGVEVVAVEINRTLAANLNTSAAVSCADFLSCSPDWRISRLRNDPVLLGSFHVILMNPPFSNAADIKHITHAVGFLKPGGRLVAICADGPRQRAQLQPLAEQSGGFYEPLPAGTFASEGTNVNTAILVIEG